MRESVASSGRVGSSALDLMDCMSAPSEVGGDDLCIVPDIGGGSREQIFDGEVRRGEFGDDLAAVEHQSPVTDLGPLLEIRRYDHDRSARLKSDIEQSIDLCFGADIDAGRRILEDIDLRRQMQPASDDHLLLVTA